MLLDSNILIDLLKDHRPAYEFLSAQDAPSISVVTWIEVLAGARSPEEEQAARALMGRLSVIPLTPLIADRAVSVRRDQRLKFPDAVIRATALTERMVLATRNTKDFDPADPSIIVPYTL